MVFRRATNYIGRTPRIRKHTPYRHENRLLLLLLWSKSKRKTKAKRKDRKTARSDERTVGMYVELTENSVIDDVCIGKTNFHRMLVVDNLLDEHGHRFVGECDIAVVVQ